MNHTDMFPDVLTVAWLLVCLRRMQVEWIQTLSSGRFFCADFFLLLLIQEEQGTSNWQMNWH